MFTPNQDTYTPPAQDTAQDQASTFVEFMASFIYRVLQSAYNRSDAENEINTAKAAVDHPNTLTKIYADLPDYNLMATKTHYDALASFTTEAEKNTL